MDNMYPLIQQALLLICAIQVLFYTQKVLLPRSTRYYLTTFLKYGNTCRYMDVLSYFRLDEEPFRLSPSPRFLYLNDQVKQATSKVEYMTKHRTAPLYMYGSI